MPQNAFFSTNSQSSAQPKNDAMMLYFHPPSLSMVIFATATVLAFVLLHNSSFNFHCYTQREATPTQKLARKCAATSRDFFAERLQSAFTLANQLRWITQYISMHKDSITTCKIINQTQQSKKKKKKKTVQFCIHSLIMTKDYVLSTKYWGG